MLASFLFSFVFPCIPSMWGSLGPGGRSRSFLVRQRCPGGALRPPAFDFPTELRAGSRPQGLETKQAGPGDMEDASGAPRICSTIHCWEKAKLPRSWASQAETGHKFISMVTRNATWTWICTGSQRRISSGLGTCLFFHGHNSGQPQPMPGIASERWAWRQGNGLKDCALLPKRD